MQGFTHNGFVGVVLHFKNPWLNTSQFQSDVTPSWRVREVSLDLGGCRTGRQHPSTSLWLYCFINKTHTVLIHTLVHTLVLSKIVNTVSFPFSFQCKAFLFNQRPVFRGWWVLHWQSSYEWKMCALERLGLPMLPTQLFTLNPKTSRKRKRKAPVSQLQQFLILLADRSPDAVVLTNLKGFPTSTKRTWWLSRHQVTDEGSGILFAVAARARLYYSLHSALCWGSCWEHLQILCEWNVSTETRLKLKVQCNQYDMLLGAEVPQIPHPQQPNFLLQSTHSVRKAGYRIFRT